MVIDLDKLGLTRRTRKGIAADAVDAATCDDPRHAFAVACLAQLLPHLAAASILLGKIRGSNGAEADMDMLHEKIREGAGAQKGKIYSAGIVDAAPVHDLTDLVRPPAAAKRGNLADLARGSGRRR